MHRIVQPMERRARKEIAVSMFQARTPVADARSHVSRGWKEHLKERNEVLPGG